MIQLIRAIVTIPPHAPYVQEVCKHPIVSGIRLNTAMEVKNPLEETLKRWKEESCGKTVWVDLKGRQIRTIEYATPPFTPVKISHNISVKTPVDAYFGNGKERATIDAIDGNILFFRDGPKRTVGPGESINIADESLIIHGYLTEKDKRYVDCAKKNDMHNYMLSFVESTEDSIALLTLDSEAIIAGKIESQKGMAYVRSDYSKDKLEKKIRLMTARGDLYVELERPHHILDAMETIITKDEDAICASRIFESLAQGRVPTCQDITDAAYLIKIGYKTLMLGDEVSMKKESIMGALNLLQAIVERT